MNVGGPPFASDLDEGRRSGRLQDHDALVKMTQATDVLNCVQSGAVEAQDLDVVTRHMDSEYSVMRWSDKPYSELRHQRPARARRHPDGRDRARRPRGDRAERRRCSAS